MDATQYFSRFRSAPQLARLFCAAICAVGVFGVGGSAVQADETASVQLVVTRAPSATVILKTTTTGDGVPLVYPTGQAMVTARVVEIPVGGETGWHRHPTPLFAYILEGEMTIVPDGAPPKHFKAGEGFMETAGWHNGRNEGDKPVRLLSVYPGAVDVPLSIKKPS
jgi:quercetin dioxygenase-like cupin family protein